ncbi:MAG: aldehyde ferredoxin oxidoreductase family protein, partial [Anaerolineae bacterium]|nr:aldehyde ferredoxin oxidoreductase family protein [Anaerolineae bacterium]
MYGYGGKILRVNLTTGTISSFPTPEDVAREYLGGRGFGIYYLYTEIPKGADPLGPENKLIASSGPLSGTLVPGAGKMDWTCKSPLTGGYASASVGGMLTAELKYAGYDAIILEGRAEKPVYLFIEDDRVELRDASDLWGLGAITTEVRLKEALGEDFQIATIGPGGENLVRYACIHHDFGRQAGRGGVGAVMGSKNLKAVAVRGTGGIQAADPKAFYQTARKMIKACKDAEALKAWQRYGTTMVVSWVQEVGAFPTRNFSTGVFEEAPNLYGEAMRQKIVITDKGCFGCPSPCGKYSYTRRHGVYVEGPEYETIGMLGADVGLGDIEDVAYANYLADELGVDTISVGSVIAFTMDCFERGIIGPDDVDGLECRFGNAEAVFTLIQKIARREGVGNLLAEGTKRVAQVWNKGAEDLAVQVKGMEVSAYECHRAPSMLLAYMTCDVGAHHNRAWAITYDIESGRDTIGPDKAERVIFLQHIRPLFDALGACRLQWVELGLDYHLYAPALPGIPLPRLPGWGRTRWCQSS